MDLRPYGDDVKYGQAINVSISRLALQQFTLYDVKSRTQLLVSLRRVLTDVGL